MTGVNVSSERPTSSWRDLDRKISFLTIALVFVAGFAYFWVITRLNGGPSAGDSGETLNTTWAVAHGRFACAYPPHNEWGLPFAAPLYPLLSGFVAWVLRIGSRVPFPSTAAMGLHCATANKAITVWAISTRSLEPTLWIGLLTWLALACGVLYWFWVWQGRWTLRALGALVAIALAPTTLFPVWSYFHPQDILAVGLAFVGLAAVSRGQWYVGGMWLGAGFLAQQFVLLAIAALFVLAGTMVWRYVAGVATAVLGVGIPLLALTKGTSAVATFIGSGNGFINPSSILGELGISNHRWVVVLRVLTIIVTMVIAWWAGRRPSYRGTPRQLVSVVGLAFITRLAFEANMYDYYVLAASVFVILVTFVVGRNWSFAAIWLVGSSILLTANPLTERLSQGLPMWFQTLMVVPLAYYVVATPLRVGDDVEGEIDDRVESVREGANESDGPTRPFREGAV